jgi:hypothetical protein
MALSQQVLFTSLHNRFYDLIYKLRLIRNHSPTRLVCGLSSAQSADNLLHHFFQGATAGCGYVPCTLKRSFIKLPFDRLQRPPLTHGTPAHPATP